MTTVAVCCECGALTGSGCPNCGKVFCQACAEMPYAFCCVDPPVEVGTASEMDGMEPTLPIALAGTPPGEPAK